MLSPASYDGAPTPPPQPSPGAFNSNSLDNRPAYQNRYASSPQEQPMSMSLPAEHRYGGGGSRYDTLPQQYNGGQSQRQYNQSPSSRMNGNVYATMPHNRVEDFSARSRQSPQIIRKSDPPPMNISAKSQSTPNININSQDYSRNNKTEPEEDLAIAR